MGTCPQSSLSSSILLCLLVEILIQVRQLSAISKKPSSRSQVDNITNDFWSWRLRQSPEFATSLGVHQFNDKLELFTTAAFQRRKEKCDGLINKIDAILDEKTMSSNDFYNLWVLRLDLSSFLSGYKWARLSMLNPLNIIEGIHRDASFWLDALPFESETDVTNYLSRLSALASQIDEHIALMQQAVDIGWTNYETSMTSVLTQLSTLTNSVTEAVLFVKPLNESLDNIPLPIYKREQIYDEAYAVIENQLLPRYKRLSYFLTEVYMPATRKEPGISSLDEGSNFYKACLHWYLSYEENIEDLLALGYDHLNQIIKRLEQIRFSERHNGDLDSFFHHLRSSNSFFFHHEKELVQRYKELVLYELPHSIHKFFFHTRLGRFSVQPMLFNGPSAFMMPGSDDGAMSPVFFVNVRNLNKQPKWRIKSAVLRETLPGRYFQNSYIANQSLASFRRWREYRKMYSVPFQFPFYTAFTEGWTLYAESLGVDMNITDPYDE